VIITGSLLAASVEPELTIDDVRQARMTLLDGISYAIQRLIANIEDPGSRSGEFGFDNSIIKELLEEDQLGEAIAELNIMKSNLIEAFGQGVVQQEVGPQIDNLISVLEKQSPI